LKFKYQLKFKNFIWNKKKLKKKIIEIKKFHLNKKSEKPQISMIIFDI